MRCPACGSAAISERPERTTQGYRRYRYGDCGKQFNAQSPCAQPCPVSERCHRTRGVWRLRYKLSLRDLVEMFLTCGFIFSYEAVRDWEAPDASACRDPASATQRQGRPQLVP
jgi:putative transposase